jgi:hypothetical protein
MICAQGVTRPAGESFEKIRGVPRTKIKNTGFPSFPFFFHGLYFVFVVSLNLNPEVYRERTPISLSSSTSGFRLKDGGLGTTYVNKH